MNDRQLNPLKTGMLFVAPGQIMDPGIMKLPHYPNHLSRLWMRSKQNWLR